MGNKEAELLIPYLKSIAESLSWITLWSFFIMVGTCSSRNVNIKNIKDLQVKEQVTNG